MKLGRSTKQIAAIITGQALVLGLMVLGASALAQVSGLSGFEPAVMAAKEVRAADCEAPEGDLATTASDLGLEFLDLSVGWRWR